MAKNVKQRVGKTPRPSAGRSALDPRPGPQPCPPSPAGHRPAGAGLIFGGAYRASDPLGHSDLFEPRELSRTAEAWGWCEWVRMCLMVAALVAACLALAPRTIALRAHAQVVRPATRLTSPANFAPPALPRQNTGPASIGSIHYWSDDDSTTVTVKLPGVVFFESHRLTHPDRIYFDLTGTELPADVDGRLIQVEVGQTFVRKIRIGQWRPGITRLVLETTRSCDYSAMIAPDPYRLVVKLHATQ